MSSSSPSTPLKRHRIGYALAPKKIQSFIQQSLINHAKTHKIDLIPIDTSKPLISQGPFDCIIHKLYGPDWKSQLQRFSSENPNVPIIDSPDSIERLHNRISMLEVASRLKIPPNRNEILEVPRQIVVTDSQNLKKENLGLGFPLIAKPLVADGSAKSHKMFLIFDNDGLEKLETPIILQDFVNHGGVIFKVYVAGDHVQFVKRKSLPDISGEKLAKMKGSLSFSQISNLTAAAQEKKSCSAREDGGGGSGDEESVEVDFERVEMPPLGFFEEVARAMREEMGLNLFNFDVIRDAKNPIRYLVIDINYFPGYAKMPNYESVLTEFFLDVVGRKKNGSGDRVVVVVDDGNVEDDEREEAK